VALRPRSQLVVALRPGIAVGPALSTRCGSRTPQRGTILPQRGTILPQRGIQIAAARQSALLRLPSISPWAARR
jgi:hypothetical protein